MAKKSRNIWVIIPAAGKGSRFNHEQPKQHTKIGKYTLLEYSVMPFLTARAISGITIAIGKDDTISRQSPYLQSDTRIHFAEGGQTRPLSVLKALLSMSEQAHGDDWVMVHDAARPCLSEGDLEKLIATLLSNEKIDGAILATPVADTLKQISAERTASKTMDRTHLWHALTPQAFRYKQLLDTLQHHVSNLSLFTDESSIMESIGQYPMVLQGLRTNIKVTYAEDHDVTESILKSIGRFRP